MRQSNAPLIAPIPLVNFTQTNLFTPATRFQEGRVFLLGDAAHTTPPYLGLDVNTAIGSVQNLAWKLGAVLTGQAPAPLLATYQTAWHPVGKAEAPGVKRAARLARAATVDRAAGAAHLDTGPARWALRFVLRRGWIMTKSRSINSRNSLKAMRFCWDG